MSAKLSGEKMTEMFGEDPLNVKKLLPELQSHLVKDRTFGVMVHHPLVISVVPLWKVCNEMYLRKKEELAVAVSQKDWERVIWLHERPYRLNKLEDLWVSGAINLHDLKELLPHVWTDAEPADEMRWAHLFEEAGFCSDADEEKIAGLQQWTAITVYRGGSKNDNLGIAWSLSRQTAEWFAYRFLTERETPYLWSGIVATKDIYAYIVARNEEEIVVDPSHVEDLRSEKLPKKRSSTVLTN
jgi:hypothetical protein